MPYLNRLQSSPKPKCGPKERPSESDNRRTTVSHWPRRCLKPRWGRAPPGTRVLRETKADAAGAWNRVHSVTGRAR